MRALLVLCFALTLFLPSGALAAKRIALLIGNKDYALDKLDLKNPHNDIAHVGTALKKVGFEVALVKDAGLGNLQIALRRYTRKLRRAGSGAIGFFYYSGHGAVNEETRTNYLIPVDVKNIDSEELWYSSVRLRSVIDELKSQAGNAQHFVVFDACRNSLQLASKTSKSLLQSKGFKAEREVRGMLISYATAEGKIASDVGDTVGPYASALAAEITKPGVEAVAMFRKVQLAVQDAINQEPWLTYGALRETYFAGAERAQASTPIATGRPPLSKEAEAWATIKGTKSPGVLKAFIEQFPKTVFAKFARARLLELEKKEGDAPKPPESLEIGPSLAQRDPEKIREVQSLLISLGFAPGPPDGRLGSQTSSAILAFQRDNNLRPDGKISGQLLAALQRAKPRELTPETNFPPIAFAPILGAPPEATQQFAHALVSAAKERHLTIVKETARPDYIVRGYVVASPDKKGAKLHYIWDINDMTGTRAHRFKGDELVAGKQGRSHWELISKDVIVRIAAKITSQIARWLSKKK